MALYTPRGLRVNLPQAYAFTLMARLYPRIDALGLLRTTDEVSALTNLARIIAGLVAFSARLDPLLVGIVVVLTSFGVNISHLTGLRVPPFGVLLPVSRVYTRFSGFGIFTVLLLVYGFFVVGWVGVASYVVAVLAGECLAPGIYLAYAKSGLNRTPFPLVWEGEMSFFNAYRLWADRLAVTRSLDVTNEETGEDKWEEVIVDLMIKAPAVVARFTEG